MRQRDRDREREQVCVKADGATCRRERVWWWGGGDLEKAEEGKDSEASSVSNDQGEGKDLISARGIPHHLPAAKNTRGQKHTAKKSGQKRGQKRVVNRWAQKERRFLLELPSTILHQPSSI